jgi:hypothetical protein
VAHHVLTDNKSFNKALLIPFLKKNNVYIFFNQKNGLEHFAAIGIIFGPHPELAWRQSIVEQLEKTITAEIITSGDDNKFNTTGQKPKVVLLLVPQQISNQKYSQTKSIALELRMPAEQEFTNIKIIDRLNERAVSNNGEEVDIILDENIGTFFLYYAKRNKPKLYDLLMRKQNFALNHTSAIPLFGYTHQVRELEIEHSGMEQTVKSILWSHDYITAIKPTASLATLGKYMVLADREFKEDVEDFIDALFEKIPELDGQPEHFRKPQRGGNAFRKNRINNIPNYLKKFEESVAVDQALTDNDSEYLASPPTRSRRLTISYAQATKRLSFQNKTILGEPKDTTSQATNGNTMMSTLTQESLNSALQKF